MNEKIVLFMKSPILNYWINQAFTKNSFIKLSDVSFDLKVAWNRMYTSSTRAEKYGVYARKCHISIPTLHYSFENCIFYIYYWMHSMAHISNTIFFWYVCSLYIEQIGQMRQWTVPIYVWHYIFFNNTFDVYLQHYILCVYIYKTEWSV